MLGKIDREQIGEKEIRGIEMKVVGRVKGVERASKKEIRYGTIGQQDRVSMIDQGNGGITTKYGTLGIWVKRAIKEQYKKIRRIG